MKGALDFIPFTTSKSHIFVGHFVIVAPYKRRILLSKNGHNKLGPCKLLAGKKMKTFMLGSLNIPKIIDGNLEDFTTSNLCYVS